MPISSFFSNIGNQARRFAGQALGRTQQSYKQLDEQLGGWLPGGAASPLSPIKESVKSTVFEKAKQVAALGLNQLPDRVNLFGRYMTGVGNQNLQLDPSTLSDLRDSTRKPDFYTIHIPDKFGGGVALQNKAGPYLPKSGAVNPYDTQPKSVTNTLGRFMATADPAANKLNFADTYDMINKSEDPDLVSGKVQPIKAWNEIEAIWNPSAMYRNRKPVLPPGTSFNPPDESYTQENLSRGLQVTGESATHSPATRFARALMYLSGQKPQPYSIDITVPYSGEIE